MKCDELDEYLSSQHGISKNKKWIPEKNGTPQSKKKVTLMTFIRHKVHHPENKTMQQENFLPDDLKNSIEEMIMIIKKEANGSKDQLLSYY